MSKTEKHLKGWPPGSLAVGDRFKILDQMRSGADVNTFSGEDRLSGEKVVIKKIAPGNVSATAVAHLEHEAHVLSRMSSPYLAPVTDVGQDHDGAVYLVMPLITGFTLKERLLLGPLDVSEVTNVGICLMDALQTIHDLGILHRDVKSSNVELRSGEKVESAVLVNFGLSRSVHLHASMHDRVVGTVRYMSPETAGTIDHEVDERSDLYSAGVVFFEALTGRPPFEAESGEKVLSQHLSAPPPAARSLRPEAPRALEEVIERLLRKDPSDRYQTAEAVRADLQEIKNAISSGNPDPHMVVGLHDRRKSLAEPSFVGRKHELNSLKELLDVAGKGAPCLAFVSSESGGGKTRLINEFAKEVAQAGVSTFRGQGLDLAAQRPFQLLSGVALDVLQTVEQDPGLVDSLKERLAEGAESVAVALPELGPVLDVPDKAVGPEEHGEFRSVRALAKLLDSLGAPNRPAVVILDDCQWADELTLKTLQRWSQGADRNGAESHTFIVAAFRSEEVPMDHPLRKVVATGDLALKGLNDEELRALAESMAGPLPTPALEAVTRLSEGSPFMASAVLRGMVEAGALHPEDDGWQVDEDAMEGVRSSRRAAAFLAQRLSLLSEATTEVLATAAVLGKEFELGLVADLWGKPLQEVVSTVHEARQRHIVWVDETSGRSAFVHDKLREAILDSVDPENKRVLHLKAGEHLERSHPERVFDIAYHYDAAGEPVKALPYALEAAQQARGQHAQAIAEEQYRIAERAVGPDDLEARRLISEGLGDTLMLRGHYQDAEPYFTQALGLATTDEARSMILGKVGELAFKRGDVESAEKANEEALRTLGKRVPRSIVGFALMALWEVLVQVMHTLFPKLLLGRKKLESAEREFIALRLYSRATHNYWFGRGTIPCGWAHFREMNLAERYPPTPELAQAYSEHAPVMTLVTKYRRGMDYAKRSLAIRQSLNDTWGQGQSMHFYGVVTYGASRYEECIDSCRRAIRFLERTGDRWEVNTATWHIALSQYRLGDLAGAVDTARRCYQSGAEIGDSQARGISLGAWAKATGGRVPEDLLAAEAAAIGRDVHTSAEVMQAEGLVLLRRKEYEHAEQKFREAKRMILRAGVMQEYVAPIFPWLVTAMRLQIEALPPWAPAHRAKLLRRARRASFWARLVASRYRNNRPHALREAALLAAASGRAGRARRLFDRSRAIADEQGARYESARTLVERGRVGLALGWRAAAEDAVAGEALIARMTVPEEDSGHEETTEDPSITPALVDRFDGLLEVGRQIAGSLSRDAVQANLHASALALLRGEECLILEVDGDENQPRVLYGQGDALPSSALVRSAVASGRPVILADDLPEDASESLELAGIRSALCAPIHVRGRITACFVITHHEMGELYGEDEQRIAEFLATIAGAAIENADGFAEVRDLSRSLEHRVAERTSELREANVQLKRANDAMRDFVSAASHDLRTPLTAVVGHASLMSRNWAQMEEDQKLWSVDVISRASNRLTQLVDDLLTISNIEGGVIDTHPEVVQVSEVISEVTAFTGRADEIKVTCPPDARVLADASHVQRMFTNYITNALKYGATPYEVTVSLTEDDVEVRVLDGGTGVPEDFAFTRLFEKFARAKTEATRKEAGTGLGLSIVRGLAEANGGKAWYQPNEPNGSCFVFTLPRAYDTRAHRMLG
ncbi:MAG: protein kinase domain-containing protein [Actinomycetota bacterium]